MLIRNGRILDPSQDLDGSFDLRIDDGVIAEIGENLSAGDGDEVLDAEGCVVVPGLIDMHVHLREPGYEYKETIETGCRAAVAGGFVAVCPMPNTNPVNDNPSVTEYISKRAAQVGLARVYPVGAVSRGEEGQMMAEVGEMARAGAVAVSDDGRPVTNARLMRKVLEYSRSFDLPVLAHEEDPELSDGGSMHEGVVSTRIGLRGIPAASEEVLIARDITLVELTGGRLHVQHVSTAGAVDLVRRAKARGLAVTCEATPHHFTLSDEDVAAANYNPNWKMNPPLRTPKDVEAILAGLADGTIDAIATDHAPHHQDEKDLDFQEAPFGIVGLETAVSLALDRLVHAGVLDLPALIRLMATRPAEILGLPGGTLRVGALADVTVLDLDAEVTVDPATFQSKAANTPFAGFELRGAPAATIVGGRLAWRAEA